MSRGSVYYLHYCAILGRETEARPYLDTLIEIILGAILSSISDSWVIEPIHTAQAYSVPVHEETVREIVQRVSLEMDFDPQIVKNVIDDETGGTWDCSLVGRDGEQGCLQIIPKFHDVDPLNFEQSVRYFISEYKEDRGHQWSVCSCIKTVKNLGVKFPVGWSAWDVVPNASPAVGGVAVYRYGTGETGFTWHVAKITELHEDGFTEKGSNLEPCKRYTRKVRWDDPHLVGFYHPYASLAQTIEEP